MAPPFNQEYNKMLRTPVILGGSRKIAVKTLQRQIQRHFREIRKLRSAQNTHIPISDLPPELLSEVFRYVVESGLQINDTRFTTGTFGFRRVSRHWNEVAIGSPRLWVWWVSGAVSAWPQFNARSKDTPLLLTWRHQPHRSIRDTLMDPTIPARLRTLDFSGTNNDLEYLLGAFNSSSPSNLSSVRLHATLYDEHEVREHPAGFLSLSFPNLSKLDIKNFLPDFSSPIFTTSNLVSLKLGVPCGGGSYYTRSQFSQILQRHPNLEELHLWQGGMPRVEPSIPLVPIVLPRLVDLRLQGTTAIVAEFVGLIGMSSPLHNVDINLESTNTFTDPNSAVKRILTLYYECQGLDYPRRADQLTISSDLGKESLVFDARSESTRTSHPTYNLKLRFNEVHNKLVEEICLLFPLDHVHEFAAVDLDLPSDEYRRMLREMVGLSHLELDNLDIGPVLDALDYDTQCEDDSDEPFGLSAPYLKSLTLTDLDIRSDLDRKLADTLDKLIDFGIVLEPLVVRSCRVYDEDTEWRLEDLVKELIWEDMTVIRADVSGSDDSDKERAESDGGEFGCGRHCDGCDECEWQFHYPYTRSYGGFGYF